MNKKFAMHFGEGKYFKYQMLAAWFLTHFIINNMDIYKEESHPEKPTDISFWSKYEILVSKHYRATPLWEQEI